MPGRFARPVRCVGGSRRAFRGCGTVLFRLAYAPKDKVWVVARKPMIFIQAEEDELKKQRLEDKVKRVFPVKP